jgi:hypothetical protein
MDVDDGMDRIESAARTHKLIDAFRSRERIYRKTLESLKAIDADDEDEGITVVTHWIVGEIDADGELPSSRAVRKRAREFCRANDYEIRDDSWLGQ